MTRPISAGSSVGLAPARGNSDLSGRTPDDLPTSPDLLLEVRGLRKYFPVRRGLLGRVVAALRAVDGVSLRLERGRTLGLVGESGSGKTTTGRSILRLIEPTAGQVRFAGEDVLAMDRTALRAFRRRAQIVFQDPFGSLNPRLTAGDVLREALAVHELARGRDAERRVRELLDLVGLPAGAADLYPHEFSGGQRQRVGIARAISVQPEFVVCDEPVSALDVSVQAQVLNLLRDLQAGLGLSYLFIAHDLSVVEHMSDTVAVMYLGRVVELGATDQVVHNPRHPYTRVLLSAVPVPDPERRRERIVPGGELPSPLAPPSGCPFHPRCPHPLRDADCARFVPPLAEKGPLHFAACMKEPSMSRGAMSQEEQSDSRERAHGRLDTPDGRV